MKRILLVLLAVTALLGVAIAHAGVTATLDPAQVSVGETAQLTVSIDGSQSSAPSIPRVPGLDIVHVGQSTQIQFINGSVSSSNIQTYEVTPQRAGTFTIPSIQVGSAKSSPLTLRVAGNGGSSSYSPPNAAGGSNLPPPNSQMPEDATAPADARHGFIQFAVPKKEFYVGELVPVDISVFLPAQANITDLPALTGEGFTLNELSRKPEQEERVVDNRRYLVLIWHSAITAVKPGDFSLSLKMPATVLVQEQRQARQRTGNSLFDQFFNDPFFNNSFPGRGVPKEITLTSEPAEVTVQSLPTAGRPTDFSGAVGHFEVQASASPANVTVGDPITLRLEVSGAGDFDRVSSNMLGGSDGWKTYPPKGTFQPEDSAGYKGTKTFEQVVIPQNASRKEIPVLSFTFFDPKTRRYETRRTTPIPVSLKGAPVSLAVANAPAAAASAGAPAPTPAPQDLVPNKVEPGHFVATLRPVFLAPWFVAAQGLPLCALAGGLLWLRRKRRFESDPRFARANAAERAIQAQLERMNQAMRQHASVDFFDSARSALQQRLGERWNVRPETITLAEIRSRLNGAGEGIRPIFEMADQVSYSGQNLGDADYRHWKELVVAQLKALEKQS